MSTISHPQHAQIRPDWLALHHEEPLEPARRIIDAHTHLYDRPGNRYLLPEMQADLSSGHHVIGTVHVQARSMYRACGPEELRPLGETEFANGIAAMSASGLYGPARICAGIVAYADLMRGADVGAILDAHMQASVRLRGIRQSLAWDPDSSLLNPAYATYEDMLVSDRFRAGFRQLAARNLSFDAWMFFHQLPRLRDLARDFPQVTIIVNHCGGVLGLNGYAGRQDEVFAQWRKNMECLAALPNVRVKLGGLGMRLSGFGLERRDRPASSDELATTWRPWIHESLALFGADRCMFESNFPVDKATCSYGVCWNAFKKLAAGASEEDLEDLFWRTAARTYRLDLDAL